MIDLFNKGIDLYRKVQGDMEVAMGLKEYAKKMHEINQVMKGVRKFSSKSEQDIADTLIKAEELTETGLEKVCVVVNLIKAQCHSLITVLKTSAVTTDKEKKDKLYLACMYLAGFAKDVEKESKEAESKLSEANHKLFEAKTQRLATIVNVLKRIQDELVEKAKESEMQQRAAAGTAIELMISYGIAAEACSIKEIENSFKKQRETVGKYIDEFKNMKTEIESLKRSLGEKRKALLEFHEKLNPAGSEVKDAIPAVLNIDTVCRSVQEVFDACEKFLKSWKPHD